MAVLLAIVISFTWQACNVHRQVQEMMILSECEFRIAGFRDIYLLDIPMDRIQGVDNLSVTDIFRLTSGLLAGDLPLKMKVNLEINNPNHRQALLNELQWKLFLKNQQMLEGAVSERVVIPARQTAILPIDVQLNIAELFRKEVVGQVVKFVVALLDESAERPEVMIRLKPSISVAGKSLYYPGWIDVRYDFTSR